MLQFLPRTPDFRPRRLVAWAAMARVMLALALAAASITPHAVAEPASAAPAPAASAAASAAPLVLDALDFGSGQAVLLNKRAIVTFHAGVVTRVERKISR